MKSLNKFATFALAGFSAAAMAQSNVQITGLIDLSVGRFQNAGASNANKLESGKLATSYIGFKGEEDLGAGLKAVWALEAFLQADSGAFGRFTNDTFWSRTSNVGLSSDWGTVRLGRQTTPLFLATSFFNAFGNSTGYSPTLRQVFSPNASALPFYGDSGWNNTIGYASPRYKDFNLNLMGSMGEGATGAFGNNIGGSLLYNNFGKGLSGAIAFQTVRNGLSTAPTGFRSQQTAQVDIAYDFSSFKLYGQLSQIKTAATVATSTKPWGFGVSVPVGAGKILAQYGSAKSQFNPTTTGTNQTLTVGYDYFLSKTTDIYLIAMNDRFTAKNTGNTLAAGLRIAF